MFTSTQLLLFSCIRALTKIYLISQKFITVSKLLIDTEIQSSGKTLACPITVLGANRAFELS